MRVIAFYDGWKIIELLKFRPLIYWVVYGDARSFEMMGISMESLANFGDYTGDILIMSDKSWRYIMNYVPSTFHNRMYIFYKAAKDMLDYTRNRYQIHKWSKAGLFQPMLYVDTDVLFDAPILPILSKILCEQRIIGQGNSGPLWRDQGVGADIFSEDGYTFSSDYPYVQGFCSGTLGIPNAMLNSSDLQTIYDGVGRYSDARKRRGVGWYDQPTANYILYKLRGECPAWLDNHVRWGGKIALHGGDRPRGLIHLWGGIDKLAEMQELSEILAGDSGRIEEWAIYGPSGQMLDPDCRIRQI